MSVENKARISKSVIWLNHKHIHPKLAITTEMFTLRTITGNILRN